MIDFILSSSENALIDLYKSKKWSYAEAMDELNNDYQTGEIDSFGYHRTASILNKLENEK